jgi:predicted N-formylglutamate amidohydrolase
VSRSRTPLLPTFTLITCEHGGRDIPVAYRQLFRGQKVLLASHRGYDVGALGVALRFASRLSAPIVFSTITRLLVDLNRSPDQPGVFSEFTQDLSDDERQRLLALYHTPHRSSVERTVSSAIVAGHRVLHLGVHSCTDILNGRPRDLDIALLFDETRVREQEFCDRCRAALRQRAGDLRYPFNEPYRGADDGLTTMLRSRHAPDDYLGIEIEVRQGMILRSSEQNAAGDLLASAVHLCLSGSTVR